MDFKNFNNQIQTQFEKMYQAGKLFKSNVSGQQVWDMYLNSFEDEKVFRDPESSEHNCNCCKNFIRRYGNIISINEEGNLESIFTDVSNVGEYSVPAKKCAKLLEGSQIQDVFFESYEMLNSGLNYEKTTKNQETYKLGIETNYKEYTQEEVNKFGSVQLGKVYEFNHFCINLPKQFVLFGSESIEQKMAFYRDKYSVFKRAMEEIPLDTLQLVKDLINQGSLLDGTAHLHAVEGMIGSKKGFEDIPLFYNRNVNDTDYWRVSCDMEVRIAKFKNTLIGVLCTELAEGMELNKACENWNKRVDPVNYHKATAPITKKQIEDAKKFVQENGYEESFNRRLATIDDIKASEILHMNSGDGKIKEVSMFDTVKATSTRHKRSEFDKLETVSIDKFMKDILPSCTSIEAFLENRMDGNLVTMTKSISDEAKKITQWNNIATNYSWTFNGNLAGKSQIKENVKAVGGNIKGVFRCSLQWNDEDTKGIVDFDLHCIASCGDHIYHGKRRQHTCKGVLDIDMINPSGIGIENIYWLNEVPNGTYKFYVKNYNDRSNKGFKIEIEFNGQTFNYFEQGNIKGETSIATVTVKNGEISIQHHLPETSSSKELWGLETNNFHKVNLVCKSPNHWGDNNFGNLHYFFMLDGCKTSNSIRGFHIENLTEDLKKHRKVLEVLGTTNMIEPTDKQLSGIGFNSTVKDELIVKVKGSHQRMLKIKF